jgi:hypothetical protein
MELHLQGDIFLKNILNFHIRKLIAVVPQKSLRIVT